MAGRPATGSHRASEAARRQYGGVAHTSRYLTMRDGTRIAIDLYLPRGLERGARIPAIIHQTRYYRSVGFRWPLSLIRGGGAASMMRGGSIRRFVQNGYAWVSIDARGTGASFGSRAQEWSGDEVQDSVEVTEWITRQPWSSGAVGAEGISYDGTSAELLAAERHPALRAVAPRFSLFDAYTDVAFPGGIHLSWFTDAWGSFNRNLDENRLASVLGGRAANLVVAGPRPVRRDWMKRELRRAIREHAANYDVHALALGVTFRDDQDPAGRRLEDHGPHACWAELEASGIPVYSYSGWYDAAFVRGAVSRYCTVNTPGSRLLLGPWPHGGVYDIGPFTSPRSTAFDHDGELLRFFGQHLRGLDTGMEDEPPVRYWTLREGRWKWATTWPPPARTHTYYFGEGRSLTLDAPEDASQGDEYRVNPSATTGTSSRWNGILDGTVVYLDRRPRDARLLTYTSAPLDRDMEVTGHPVVTLFVRSSAEDGQFFAYLEDVYPDGRVGYVTEGMLRAIHRKVSIEEPPYRSPGPYHTYRRQDAMPLVPGQVAEIVFDLLPTSYLFRNGHRLRVALAGADRDHFAPLPGEPSVWEVYRGGEFASRVDLPVVGAS